MKQIDDSLLHKRASDGFLPSFLLMNPMNMTNDGSRFRIIHSQWLLHTLQRIKSAVE